MGINSTFSLAKQNTPVGGGGGASPLTNGIFLPNAVPVYDLDENFQMQYDENGKPLYNFKNPIFQDMNVISFAQTDKYATNTYRVLVNPYVDFNFMEFIGKQVFHMIILIWMKRNGIMRSMVMVKLHKDACTNMPFGTTLLD